MQSSGGSCKSPQTPQPNIKCILKHNSFGITERKRHRILIVSQNFTCMQLMSLCSAFLVFILSTVALGSVAVKPAAPGGALKVVSISEKQTEMLIALGNSEVTHKGTLLYCTNSKLCAVKG